MMPETEQITNIENPIIEINHSELKKWDTTSHYKRTCKVCNRGLLPVRRDNINFELEELDYCLMCGQRYRYLDIVALRIFDQTGVLK